MTFVIYRDVRGEFRWRLFAANNRIIADSGEGYVNKLDCQNGISLVQGSYNATIQDQTTR
jgi:uncharacterized protein YegP (UPF0339 family)